MKESAHAALSYIRSQGTRLGIDPGIFSKQDIHIHVPAGAIPKDGPSAGITMAVALISALTKNPVRGNLTMSGEVTLSGRVLPIGGLKEKVLAAHRSDITHIIIPKENEKDIEEIPRKIKKNITFHPARTMEEVIQLSFVEKFI